MTNDTPQDALSFDASEFIEQMDEVADRQDVTTKRRLGSDLVIEFRRVVRPLPLHVQEKLLGHLRQARQASLEQDSPMVALQALTGGQGQAPTINGSGQQATQDNSSNQLEPEDQAVLDALEGQTSIRRRYTADMLRGLFSVRSDRLGGTLQAIESLVSGRLRVDNDGRPEDLVRAEKKVESLEREREELQQQLDQLTEQHQQELEAARSGASNSDQELLDTVRAHIKEIYRIFGWGTLKDEDLDSREKTLRLLKQLAGYINSTGTGGLGHFRKEAENANAAKQTAEDKLAVVRGTFGALSAEIDQLTGSVFKNEGDQVAVVKERRDDLADELANK